MGRRREGREAAVQYLFSHDLNKEEPDDEDLDRFFSLRVARTPVREFATELVRGITGHLEAIDDHVARLARNYELNRISTVDRNILRLAIHEMLHCPEIPAAVSINEAIEIAKRFGTEESGRFVNGILDQFRREQEEVVS